MVVCGNINFESVNGFLSDFFHPAREDVNCEVGKPEELYLIPFILFQVVFLNKSEPDLEFEGGLDQSIVEMVDGFRVQFRILIIFFQVC